MTTITDTAAGYPARIGTEDRDLQRLDALGLALAIIMTLGPLLATAVFAH